MASTPVLDSNGDEVRAGVAYKINSLIRTHGSLTLRGTGNNPCPLDVSLTGYHECVFNPACGLPLTFHPEEGNQLVRLNRDLNIKFEATTACEESTVWQVVRDESVDRDIVSSGGVLGNELSPSWFAMEPVDLQMPHVYRFRYCLRNSTVSVCSNIGLAQNLRLSVLKEGEYPFYFTIAKVTATLLSSVV